MSQEIEIEYKNLITESEYEQLRAAYPLHGEDEKTQDNYYFETINRKLGRLGYALRIREKAGTYTVTLKEPHSSGLLETHDRISRETCNHWINGNIIPQPNTSERLQPIGIRPEHLMYVGCLETVRLEVAYRDALLVLDKSMYNGQTDYELEVEAPEASLGNDVFETILAEQRIPNRDTPNKIQRFFASLQHDRPS